MAYKKDASGKRLFKEVFCTLFMSGRLMAFDGFADCDNRNNKAYADYYNIDNYRPNVFCVILNPNLSRILYCLITYTSLRPIC